MSWRFKLLYLFPVFGFVWAVPEAAGGNIFDATVTVLLSMLGYEALKELDKQS